MKKIKSFLHSNWPYLTASFLIPFTIMLLVYLSIGIYWGSERSVMASDAFSQFSNFHASFNNMLHGKQSFFYTWNASLGLNYLALVSYYLGGLFTPLVFFFRNENIPDALYLLTLLKIGSAGVSFWVLARNTFRIPKWGHVVLSVPYALMSFATAHSEIIMWLDAFVYLPLVILGIHRVMDQRKPVLLFVSYLLLFVSNFYMGFMIGVFSFLYFWARTATDWRRYWRRSGSYLLTSLLAGGASMIIILPTVLDLRSNGETLSQITKLKTEATGFWDILMKNMIGVYDTTKYGSIPFIYVGLLPLAFCVFYFVCRKIPWKNKIAYGLLFAVLIASFYLVPLNLFWHGMHAPNMFLFRYSFLFSFLVVLLAGYGWEQFRRTDLGVFAGTLIILIAVFALGESFTPTDTYEFISLESFLLTILFLLLYVVTIFFFQWLKFPPRRLAILLLLLVSAEAAVNTRNMVTGILDDWNYASRSLYSEPYPAIKQLVDKSQASETSFYRLENLDPVSSDDSINYGYSGVSLFSSIRNRNSSAYLDQLGFRSRGTSLNIRYQNNTLLMDSLLGVKYNIATQNPQKYGFNSVTTAKEYQLYRNDYALPLGMLTDKNLYDVEQPANDNLGSQTNLLNQLAGRAENYYQFYYPTVIGQENTTIQESGNSVTFKEKEGELAKDITWQVEVPAHTQAYLSLFPTNFGQLESSSVTIAVNGVTNKSQINITGQYYNLGYYNQNTLVTFTASFYGTPEASFQKPVVVGLDIPAFTESIKAIQDKGVTLTTGNRTAEGTVDLAEEQVVFTTIPYDKGWRAYVDGKQVKIKDYQNAFVTFSVPAGKHTIKLSYLPQGFMIGAISFVVCIALFLGYLWYLQRRERKELVVEE